MKTSSLYFKNFIVTASLVIFSFLMLATAFMFLGRNYVVNENRDEMNDNADEIVHTALALSDTDGNINSWELRLVISSMSKSSNNHIFITDSSGTVVLCSDRELVCKHIGSTITQYVMTQLQEDGSIDQLTSLEDFYDSTRFVVAKPITNSEGSIIGYVFISNDTASIIGDYRTLLLICLIMFITVLLISLLLSLIFSKKMTEPIDDITRAARKFAHGDFSVRIANKDNRTDEVGALIDSFNEMADSLESSEQRRQEFIANVSHELRTPMTTINGFAEGILDGTIPKDMQDKYLLAISDETRRLTRLVKNMLDTSQVQAKVSDKSRRKNFDLTELILQTLLSFEKRAEEKNLGMDLQLPENHIYVFADPDAITQVIYNITDNAIKFAHPDTDLTVHLYKNIDKAFVSIKDHGETIPPDDLPYIFDRFHKSDRSRSLDKNGVGLGLYLVKTIINSHDEDIVCTSHDNVTEFVFTLALAGQEDTKLPKNKKEKRD